MSATTLSAIIPFTPTNAGPQQFNATFDSNNYVCMVTWNTWRQGWYLNIYTLAGALIVCRALVPSPPTAGINLLFGYFVTTALVFDDTTQAFWVFS